MDLRVWLRTLAKSWWIIVVALVVGVSAGALIAARTPPVYASDMTFFVRTPAAQIGGAFQGDQFAQKRVNSYVQLAKSQRLAQQVIDKLQIPDLTSAQLTPEISAAGDPNTVLLNVTVTDTDPQRSLDIANGVESSLIGLVATLETPPDTNVPSVTLETTSAPTLNPSPVAPRTSLIMAIGALAGLLLGLAIVVARELLDTSVRTAEVLKRVTGRGVLASIPFDSNVKKAPLIIDTSASSNRAEAFRQLRTNLQFVDVDNPVQAIVVTSSVAEEGKSSTAANLALAFAEAGQKVLLIEADLRRPKVAEYLGLDSSLGLTDVLAGRVVVDEVLQPWGRGGLTVLPSGTTPPNPSELLGSNSMSQLIDAMRAAFDLIVIDTPPLLPVTDGAVVAARVDGALIVVRCGRTSRGQVEVATQALEAVDAKILGSVLSMAPVGASGYGYSTYYTAEKGTDSGAASPKVESLPIQGEGSARHLSASAQ